ncbi:MFS transporter [Bacillus sp. es.034]|uniref:MFS transporter n=1 Tax=Bacillus sp. es.034 TaxID=1761763 RepID=UPI000BF77E7B|nr:MFS transporter [Bacillus sp. es.034]PFG05297.1 putative MFS family arabinose efflux permease [Bacillus sp. es.034]
MEKTSSKSNIIITALITGICLLTDSMLYIALPLYWKEAGLSSLIEVGLLLSVNRLIRIPLNPFAAFITRTLNLRPSLLLAICLTIIVNIGFFSLNGLLFWLILRCVWGFAWALLRLTGQLMVVQLSTNSNKGHLMGMYNGTYRLGSLAGMTIGGFLCYQIGLKLTCLVFACICSLAIPFIFFLSYKSLPPRQESRIIKLSLLKKRGIQLSLFRGFIVSFLLQGVFLSTVSFYLSKHYGGTLTFNGILLTSGVVSGLLLGMRWAWEPFLAPFIGRVSDGKWGRQSILLSALLIIGSLYPFMDSQLPFMIWGLIIIAILICSTIITTLTDTLVSDEAYQIEGRTSLINYYSIAVDFGAALGPLIAYQFITEGKLFLFLCSGLAICLAMISSNEHLKQKDKCSSVTQ